MSLKLLDSTFLSFGVKVYVFFASLFVCTLIVNVTILNIINILFLLYMLFFMFLYKVKSITLDIPIILFFAPFIISILSASLNLAFVNDYDYYQYYLTQMPLRIINCLVFFLLYILSSRYLIKTDNSLFKGILKTYLYGIILFLVLFGCWQILHMLTGIWVPEVESRSYIHSLEDKSDFLDFFRVTSLADEPSYLVPFLIDGFILSLFLKKYKLAPFFVIVLLFSISLGGYVNFFFIIGYGFFLQRKHFSLKKSLSVLFVFLLIIVFIIFCFPSIFEPLFAITLNRKEIVDASFMESARGQTVVMPWIYLFDGTFWSVLFGNGPASMKFLNATKILVDGSHFHTTSNNIITDYVFESGILGLVFLFSFFFYLYVNLPKENIHNKSNIFFAKILIIHVLISSLYRADYVSPRFWIMILIIVYFQKLARNDNSNNTNIQTK